MSARRPTRILLGAMIAAILVAALAASDRALAQPSAGPTPAWSALGADQQNLLAPFADEWDDWLDGERRAWLALAARFPTMPPAEQLRARERIRQWAQLSPEERRVARANFGVARRIPEHERIERWQRYRSMTPEQRAVLRQHGRTSNTAAGLAGSRVGLAREAARPLAETAPPRSPRAGADGSTR
jgi:hypothetical protein